MNNPQACLWAESRQHIYLVPSKVILFRYRQDGDKEAYTKSYLNYLGTLDACRIVKNLDGKILCCYEKPGDFCHRHILAEWLKEYGADCEELK